MMAEFNPCVRLILTVQKNHAAYSNAIHPNATADTNMPTARRETRNVTATINARAIRMCIMKIDLSQSTITSFAAAILSRKPMNEVVNQTICTIAASAAATKAKR